MKKDNIDFETILDNMDCGVWVVDEKGDFIFTNRAFLKMTRRSRDWFNNHSVYKICEDGYTDYVVSDLVFKSKQKMSLFQRVREKDINHFYSQIVSATPIFDEKGNVQNILSTVHSLDLLNYIYQEAMNRDEEVNLYLNVNPPRSTPKIIARSKEMKDLLHMADKVAGVDSAILISGESGVGKNVLASYVHDHSARHERDMVEINCASVPEGLLEAELFGYEKGAFTGALDGGKKGLFEEADGGTLFLDEINSLPLSLQGKLLRIIETKKMRRVGSNKDIYVDFRLIVATNFELMDCVNQGTFRADLYYRLNVIPLLVPPLRSRKKDIVPLCMHFLKYYCTNYDRVKMLSDRVLEQIIDYDWPGNVRELRNFVERMVVMSSRDVVEIQDISDSLFSISSPSLPLHYESDNFTPIFVNATSSQDFEDEEFSMQSYLGRCEREVLEKVLKKYKSTYKAAQVLKLSQATVARRKEKYQIEY